MKRGFTIVELLIVIVVIAILAAITIVAYNGIQQRARAAGVQSDMINAKKKLMLWKASNDRYPINATELADVGMRFTRVLYNPNANNVTYCVDTATDRFAIGGQLISDNISYFTSSEGGIQSAAGEARAVQVCNVLGISYPSTGVYAANGFVTPSTWNSWAQG